MERHLLKNGCTESHRVMKRRYLHSTCGIDAMSSAEVPRIVKFKVNSLAISLSVNAFHVSYLSVVIS